MGNRVIIVDTLTFPGIVEVAKTDTRPINAAIADNVRGFAREVTRRHPRTAMCSKPVNIKRPTGITWHIRYFVKDYHDYKRNGPVYTLYGTFYYRGGMFAVFTYGNPYEYAIFTPHFFERYCERFLNEDLPITEAMEIFFKNNSISYTEPQPERENGIFATVAQGAALGENVEGLQVYKTYITPPMLYEYQQGQRDTGLKIIEKTKII